MTHQSTRKVTAIALAIVAGSATVAQAQAIGKNDANQQSYITTADVSNPNGTNINNPGGTAPSSGSPTGFNDPDLGFNNQRYWAKDAKYSGVTRLIMTYQTKNLTTNAIGVAQFLCSGSVISGGQAVLTAGHCVVNSVSGTGSAATSYTLQNVQVSLGQQFGGNTTQEPGAGAFNVNQGFNYNQTVLSGNVKIHPDYTGAVIDQRDVAIINLNTVVPPIYQSYELYKGDPLSADYNIVGWGGRGNGAQGTVNIGGSTGSNSRIRQGNNSWDTTMGDDTNWSAAFRADFYNNQHILMSDFDNGQNANDALCRLSFATYQGSPVWVGAEADRPCDVGLGIMEVSSAGGDSGGPSFINGQIAGVTSFGQSFGTGFGDFKAGLNSSFGELNGMTDVKFNDEWIEENAAPEPASLVLMATGLVGLAGAARRRRSK